MAHITNGYANMAVGGSALYNVTTGFNNTAIGTYALYNLTSGSENTALGYIALYSITTGTDNFAYGSRASANLTDGVDNLSIGTFSLYQNVHRSGNVAIGSHALENNVNSDANIAIGYAAGQLGTGGFRPNIYIGYNCAQSLTGASGDNIWIGSYTGTSAVISNSIVIGGDTSHTLLDYNVTTPYAWSINYNFTTGGYPSLAIYSNNQDATGPSMVNYERVQLGWNATVNTFRITAQQGGTGVLRLIAIDGFQKAGAPAAGDLPSGTMALINDTSGGNTWLCYNAAGTIRKVQLT
jgi:hypothetical protein